MQNICNSWQPKEKNSEKEGGSSGGHELIWWPDKRKKRDFPGFRRIYKVPGILKIFESLLDISFDNPRGHSHRRFSLLSAPTLPSPGSDAPLYLLIPLPSSMTSSLQEGMCVLTGHLNLLHPWLTLPRQSPTRVLLPSVLGANRMRQSWFRSQGKIFFLDQSMERWGLPPSRAGSPHGPWVEQLYRDLVSREGRGVLAGGRAQLSCACARWHRGLRISARGPPRHLESGCRWQHLRTRPGGHQNSHFSVGTQACSAGWKASARLWASETGLSTKKKEKKKKKVRLYYPTSVLLSLGIVHGLCLVTLLQVRDESSPKNRCKPLLFLQWNQIWSSTRSTKNFRQSWG